MDNKGGLILSYVDISNMYTRVTSKKGLKILLTDDEGQDTTKLVSYKITINWE